MASRRLKGFVGVVVASSMMLSSTAAVAAASAPVQADPWAVLTAMSQGAPAAAMCGSSEAAANAQAGAGCVLPVSDAVPPPPPENVPPPALVGGGGINPLFIALIAIAAGIGIFLAVNDSGNANSPA